MDPFFMRFLPQSGTSCREIWVRLQDKDYQHFVQYGLILHILTDILPVLYLKYQFWHSWQRTQTVYVAGLWFWC